jgi:hypothetical protein
MKIYVAIGMLLLCLGCSSLAFAQRVEREFIVNAIKIKLATDQPVVSIGDQVIVKFTFTNTSNVELPITRWDWMVSRENGKPVTHAPEGMRRMEARRAAQSVNVPLYLGPGASNSQEETLSKLYVMNEPGVYLVSLRIEVTDKAKTDFIKSNTLRITVQ